MGCQRRIRFALLLVICVVMSECAWAQLKPGIVVEEVAKHSEAEKAGLQAGDVLLSWSRGDAKGGIESPFDLSATAAVSPSKGFEVPRGRPG